MTASGSSRDVVPRAEHRAGKHGVLKTEPQEKGDSLKSHCSILTSIDGRFRSSGLMGRRDGIRQHTRAKTHKEHARVNLKHLS